MDWICRKRNVERNAKDGRMVHHDTRYSLEKRGYVNRRPHPTDPRMIWVEPTELGRQVADEFRPIVHRHQKAWLSILSEA